MIQMPRAQYIVRQDGNGWSVFFDGKPYGPYVDPLDAFKVAAHSADEARKQNPLGAEVLLDAEGVPRAIWRSEDDVYPMDFRARLGLPPLF